MLLEVENVSKNFSGIKALDNVSIAVRKGELSSIIGPNGAGKSTLFNILTGEIEEDSGRVIFKGEDITNLAPHEICRRGVGRSFQLLNLFSQLTVYKNIQTAILAGRKLTVNFLHPAKNMVRNEVEEILEQIGLADKGNSIASEISYGEQRKLEFGIALANSPDIILLDEPTAGLSIEETKSMIDLIQRLAEERFLTVLLVEHKMDVVFSISEKIRVLYEGRIIFEGVPDEVRRSEEVLRVYLGEKD